jgi:hypothetical protein
MIYSIIFGFSLGLFGSILNHWLKVRSLKNIEIKSFSQGKFTAGFLLRQFINIFVLFLVRKDVWMLIAAAVGLTMVKNYLLLYYTLGRKGVR